MFCYTSNPTNVHVFSLCCYTVFTDIYVWKYIISILLHAHDFETVYLVNVCLHCHTRHIDEGCKLLHLIHLAVHLLYTLFNTCHSQKKKTYVCTMKSMFNFFYILLKMNLYMTGTDDDLCGVLFVCLYRFVKGQFLLWQTLLSYPNMFCKLLVIMWKTKAKLTDEKTKR